MRERLTSTHIVYIVALLTLLIGAVLLAAAGRSMFSPGNISSILTGTSVLGFIAIGQTLVILVGSLDLSVPYVTSLASLIAAGVMANRSENVLPGVLLALGAAAAIGLANGLIVSGLNVHGFIATLGMGLVISGYLATNYKGSFGQTPLSFRMVGATGLGPVPISTLIMLGCAGLAMLLLHRTRTGHRIYAIGGDRNVARMSGIHVKAPVIAAHVICSVLAGMAGLLLASRLGVGSPTVGSQGGYDLLSIAAVVLGGTLLSGGKGTISGTLGGVLIFAMLDNVMSVLQINPFLKDVVRGIVIVAAVAVYARRSIVVRPRRFGPAGREPVRAEPVRAGEGAA